MSYSLLFATIVLVLVLYILVHKKIWQENFDPARFHDKDMVVRLDKQHKYSVPSLLNFEQGRNTDTMMYLGTGIDRRAWP